MNPSAFYDQLFEKYETAFILEDGKIWVTSYVFSTLDC